MHKRGGSFSKGRRKGSICDGADWLLGNKRHWSMSGLNVFAWASFCFCFETVEANACTNDNSRRRLWWHVICIEGSDLLSQNHFNCRETWNDSRQTLVFLFKTGYTNTRTHGHTYTTNTRIHRSSGRRKEHGQTYYEWFIKSLIRD